MKPHKTFWKKPKAKIEGVAKEDDLQSFTDDYLDIRHLKNYRIPNKFFAWLNGYAPAWAKAAFNKVFAGFPDNLVLIRVSDKYCLCLNLELKSKLGSLHGRQKANARDYSWQIARTHNEVETIVQEFVENASTIQRLLEDDSASTEEPQQEQNPPRSSGW